MYITRNRQYNKTSTQKVILSHEFTSELLQENPFVTGFQYCCNDCLRPEHLECGTSGTSEKVSQPTRIQRHLSELTKQADKALNAHHLSVMMKDKTPPSGDKHDYLSQARYFWPDPTKPDGKPYISRDGVSNPELDKLDRNRLGEMANNVTTLALRGISVAKNSMH